MGAGGHPGSARRHRRRHRRRRLYAAFRARHPRFHRPPGRRGNRITSGEVMKRIPTLLVVLALGSSVAACGGGGTSASGADTAHGPIKIWYSNNPDEVAWGKAMVSAWNG